MPLETEETSAETTRDDLPVTTPPAESTPLDQDAPLDESTPLVTVAEPVGSAEPADTAEPVISVTPSADVSPTEAAEPAVNAPPIADDVTDGPLLPDTGDLHGNWQRVQAAFVDDPRASVTEAADLVEHAAQALAGALQQRQRTLREQWDGEGDVNGDTAADTERLRRTLKQYRSVFNQICGV
jgi:hypothetical protein